MLRSSHSVCANLAEAWQKRRYRGAFVAKLNEVEAESEIKRRKRSQEKQEQRHQWQESFNHDVIELKHLPKAIVKKARSILSALQEGKQYWQLSGKRLVMMHHIIKIPVTHRYRMLCQDEGGQMKPLKVISHETYNPLVRHPKRLLKTLLSKVKVSS